MPELVNHLSDADITAISLVRKGANRKRIFLRKEGEEEDLFDLGAARIVKGDADWSVAYFIVAEPGHREHPGALAKDADTDDEWASEDEIQKAAWRFMENGANVTLLHESMQRFGTVVENAIAFADFEVGQETIKKGSWYIGIRPKDELKPALESGELEAVSIEGEAVRTLVEKTHAGEMHHRAGPLRHLIAYYMKKPHPFRACVRDNRKRFGPRTEAICAGLKDIALGTHKWRAQFKGKPGYVAKAQGPTQADTIAGLTAGWYEKELTDGDAWLALEAVREKERKSPMKKLLDKLFKSGVLTDDDVAELDRDLADYGNVPAEELQAQAEPEEDKDMGLTPDESQRFETIEKRVGELGEGLKALTEGVNTLVEKHKQEEPPTMDELRKELQTVGGAVVGISKKLDVLAAGDSRQNGDGDPKEKFQKSEDALYLEGLFGGE